MICNLNRVEYFKSVKIFRKQYFKCLRFIVVGISIFSLLSCSSKVPSATEIPRTNMTQEVNQSRLIKFYLGTGTNQSNRSIFDIWAFTFDELESNHDFIQWLFPLPVASQSCIDSPILTPLEIQFFKSRPDFQARLLRSFEVMLSFYGMERLVETAGVRIQKVAGFDQSANALNWLRSGNHNFLRITRIISSLKLLGLDIEAQAFFRVLEQEVYPQYSQIIRRRSFEFWENAAINTLK